jgi:4-amino-4-deoxy-L-arabinose transferase
MKSLTPVFILILLCLALALGFQGSRGMWEPDEGFYFPPALTMLTTGDWIVPQHNLRPFLEKPPMVYWGCALGMKILGINEWGARLANALWYLLTVLSVGLLGWSLFDRRTGYLAALIYAITPVPLVAANVVTPDTPLTFWVTASMACFWKAVESDASRKVRFWKIVLGICLGFGVLSKGPAMILFLAPMGLYLFHSKRTLSFFFKWDFPPALALFILIAGFWYWRLSRYVPGALSYALDNQVIGRLVTAKYERNPEFYKPFVIYLPALIFGSLPWSAAWYPRIRENWEWFKGWPSRLKAREESPDLFLTLWILLPLMVFFVASSRLFLYVLPLFPPLSIITARCWLAWKPAWFSPPYTARRLAPLAAWSAILLVVKGGMAFYPTPENTRQVWEGVKDYLPEGRNTIIVVNGRMNGLSFYSRGNVEAVTTRSDPYPTFSMPERIEEELHEMTKSSDSHTFIVRSRDYPNISGLLRQASQTFTEYPGPFDTHVLVCTPADTERQLVRLAALGDTRSGNSLQIQLGSALYHYDEDQPLHGIILLGDNISFTGDPALFDDHIEKPYEALIRNGVRFFAVFGNHDISGGFADFQLKNPFFNMNGQRYYTREFGHGLVQGFFLDSNTLFGDRPQLVWLHRELKKSAATWKIAAMHYPLYGSTKRRPQPDLNLRAELEPILVEGGVNIVVAGHNHVYQRLRPRKGIQHFTAGSGGELDRGSLIPEDPDLLAGEDQTTVALILEFGPKECEFKAIVGSERVIDQGIIPLTSPGIRSASPEEAAGP